MNPSKLTYADVVKNASTFLNRGMDPAPLIPKEPRIRLGEEAVQKLRSFIHGEPKLEAVTSATSNQVEALEKKRDRPAKVSEKQSSNQSLVLAGASAGILPGFEMGDRRFMKSSVNSAYVSLLKPNEMENTVREGVKGNPIDVVDDSEDEFAKSEEPKSFDHYSVDGRDISVDTSEFNANEFLNEVIDQTNNVRTEEVRKEPLELNRMLRLEPTTQLKKSKRRMEEAFMNDYAVKMKSFKRDYRDEYEGEYTFIVKLGVVDNVVEVKETVTFCKLVQLEDKTHESDEDYKPESELEPTSDIDEK